MHFDGEHIEPGLESPLSEGNSAHFVFIGDRAGGIGVEGGVGRQVGIPVDLHSVQEDGGGIVAHKPELRIGEPAEISQEKAAPKLSGGVLGHVEGIGGRGVDKSGGRGLIDLAVAEFPVAARP